MMVGRVQGIGLRTYDNLDKAVQLGKADGAGRDPLAAANEILSGGKIRSFYNNIALPNQTDDVTVEFDITNGFFQEGNNDTAKPAGQGDRLRERIESGSMRSELSGPA